MTDLERRSFLSAVTASLGLATAASGDRLAAVSQVPTASTPHPIDVYHHFAQPAWIAEVKGRPLLQAYKMDAAQSVEDLDRGGVVAAMVSITNPGLWFGDAAVTNRPGPRLQRVRCQAGPGPSGAI
ncbi:MAG: hypothetical protein ABIS29_08980, partial [Vicinamibacterales bacterium]